VLFHGRPRLQSYSLRGGINKSLWERQPEVGGGEQYKDGGGNARRAHFCC